MHTIYSTTLHNHKTTALKNSSCPDFAKTRNCIICSNQIFILMHNESPRQKMMKQLTYHNVKYADANLDAPDNAISDNESSSEMLTSQSQISE